MSCHSRLSRCRLFYCTSLLLLFFFFNDTATTEIYTLSLHDALPISCAASDIRASQFARVSIVTSTFEGFVCIVRSEEHTSELQSRQYLVCRLLLEKKKTKNTRNTLPPKLPTLRPQQTPPSRDHHYHH